MSFDPRRHNRQSKRLRGWDYSGCGAYFVTVCASERRPIFGVVEGDAVRLNGHGRVVARLWRETAQARPEITLDKWIVMPDHFHAIVWMPDPLERPSLAGRSLYRPPRSLGSLMAGWKSRVTSCLWALRSERGWPLFNIWQSNYHDHIIRSEKELDAVRLYIEQNPARWHEDQHFG